MLNFIILIYIFIIGLCIGSFLNVCIYRIPKNKSLSFPPSHCTNCDTNLKTIDLVPVFSYIFLKGKCRYCSTKISIKYPLIELVTGVIFIALYLEYGLTVTFFKFTTLVVFLIVIGMIDFDTTDVYLKTTLSGVGLGLGFIIYNYFLHNSVSSYFYGGLLGGGVIALIVMITKGMGWGDVEICALVGLYMGFRLTIVMLFFSFILGGFIGAALILLKKKSRKDYIPFGPFIALSGIFTILFGDKIVLWYLGRL